MNLSKFASKTIEISFYILFFFVPLFWLPITSELFEFNKMILVYLLTVLVVGGWMVKSLSDKKFELRRTPLDLPIALFLLANIFSTIFSLDSHTSIFGYYGRWHGGLLSTFSYIILYYALLTHFDKKQIIYFLATLFTSGLIVSIYAVLQHPNPIFREVSGGKTVFHGIDYNYWAVDVENRVFSTFGQPNWLAGFLSILILPLISLLFVFKKFWQQFLVFLVIAVYYVAFTFTYSRGGSVGLLVGVATFVILFPIYKPTVIEWLKSKIPLVDLSQTLGKLKLFLVPILLLILLVFTVNQFFGNALVRRGGLTTKVSETVSQKGSERISKPPTALETNGIGTARIRTIVWTGAIETFKHYPIFGSGVETFGYSYYLFRPTTHNYTGEWDFLYNKAHNEYLNYLSTTGALGFLSYLLLIAIFELIAIKTIVNSNFSDRRLLNLGILAGFNANLAQNFFGFSVVATAVLLFIYPGVFFAINDFLVKSFMLEFKHKLTFLEKSLFNRAALTLATFLTLLGIIFVFSMWAADLFYNKSLTSDTYQTSISSVRTAVKLNSTEPLYKSELAKNLAALVSTAALGIDSKSKDYKYVIEARELTNKVVAEHPNNTALWIDKRTIDYNLTKIDPSQNLELLRTAGKLKELAPTDASIQYDVALVYLYLEKNQEAVGQLEKVVALKKDYQEAIIMLARTYSQVGENTKAIKLLQNFLKTNPNDPEALDLLKTLLTG